MQCVQVIEMEASSKSEKDFDRKLKTYSSQVLMYEDPERQRIVLNVISRDILLSRASRNRYASSDFGKDEFVIRELLKWFKFEFFSWVDHPACEFCNRGIMEFKGYGDPNAVELEMGASTVETYLCSQCAQLTRFPRYNDPAVLFRTRMGRCGEWANCFTLLCRALNYEARLVVEWDDHVWTEVYFPDCQKWVHCDPCENSFNSPLMYEKGWGKKLRYVLAFSKDEVQDVTWRYSQHHREVLKRRTLCRESWLLHCCTVLTNQLQVNLTACEKDALLMRKVCELAQFFQQHTIKETEQQGRTSGSLAWRVARGECNQSSADNMIVSGECNQSSADNMIVRLNECEIKARKLHLKYCCASDKYVRVLNSSETVSWDSLIYLHSGIFRKVENDWNMVYLARSEKSLSGNILWKFSFEESGLVIDHINLRLIGKTFEDGLVKWTLSSGEKEICILGDTQFLCTDFKGLSEFSLSAHLSGGKGPAAWQHAQLFRQSLDSTDFPFEVVVNLCEKTF